MNIDRDLEIIKGDSKQYELRFKNSAGVPINITGATVYFTVKKSYDLDDTNATIQVINTVHQDAINGISTIVLTPEMTKKEIGNYVYDIQIKRATDNIKTVMRGNFKISYEVTKAA